MLRNQVPIQSMKRFIAFGHLLCGYYILLLELSNMEPFGGSIENIGVVL